jgi:hypothetical protein
MRTAFIWLFLIICQPAFAQPPEHIPQPFATQGRDCGPALRAIYSPALADSQSSTTFTISDISQSLVVTPAAIAGVILSV